MRFEEQLVTLRKSKGMNQEQLAEKIGVSRQAVSKWETADAQPDFTKLIALADVLEVDLDVLCGRTQENLPIGKEKKQGTAKESILRIAITAFLACILFGLGVFVGIFLSHGGAVSSHTVQANVSALKFVRMANSDSVNFHFIPTVVGEGCTYTLYLSDGNSEKAIDVECRDGRCAGKVTLEPHKTYSAKLVISDGKKSYSTTLTSSLRLGQNIVLWE